MNSNNQISFSLPSPEKCKWRLRLTLVSSSWFSTIIVHKNLNLQNHKLLATAKHENSKESFLNSKKSQERLGGITNSLFFLVNQ
jgi:hypothetical protein